MADIKFACPHCQQHIQADSGYAGMQITCPACHGSLLVPGTPVAPAPAPAAAPPPQPSYRIAGAPPSPAAAPAAHAPASGSCPSCGAAMSRGAVLCVRCGYNTSTGKRTVAGRPAAVGKPADPWAAPPWYKTPYPYIGVVFVLLAILYFLGKSNPVMKAAFIGVALLYYIAAHIIVTIAAFREGIGTGFLTFCIGFYTIYFVFKVNEDDRLKILYGTGLAMFLIIRFLPLD